MTTRINPNVQSIRVLLVDDDEDDYFITNDLVRDIRRVNITLDWEPDYGQALTRIMTGNYDLFLIDYRLGEHSGIELVNRAIQMGNVMPYIVLTGQEDAGGIDLDALKAGATDYLIKGRLDTYNLERAIVYALERTRVLEELFEKDQRARTLFRKSSDAIFAADVNDYFIEVNEAACRLFRTEQDEFVGMKMADLFADPTDYREFREHITDPATAGSPMEVILKSKTGHKINCLLTTDMLTDSNGKLKGFQGIVHDITQRKKAERELMFAEKLGMTGRIARSIAHEVRNPLTNVILSVEQLKYELPPDNDSYTFYIDIISNNCKRINQLITELLDSAKPAELLLKQNNINDAIEEATALAGDRMKLLNIRLIKDFDNNVPNFSFDKDKMKLALLNIIINALEAMPGDEGVLNVSSRLHDNIVTITIEDNGLGIPKENLGKLFDAFFTGKKNGMGLGLTTTQNIVSTHKGTIDIESEIGKGTKFHINFNLSTQEVAEKAAAL
ncbi:MAG: ATP-binding protein [Bacteroidota bacterium]